MDGERSEEKKGLGEDGLSFQVTASLHEDLPLPRFPRRGFLEGGWCRTQPEKRGRMLSPANLQLRRGQSQGGNRTQPPRTRVQNIQGLRNEGITLFQDGPGEFQVVLGAWLRARGDRLFKNRCGLFEPAKLPERPSLNEQGRSPDLDLSKKDKGTPWVPAVQFQRCETDRNSGMIGAHGPGRSVVRLGCQPVPSQPVQISALEVEVRIPRVFRKEMGEIRNLSGRVLVSLGNPDPDA